MCANALSAAVTVAKRTQALKAVQITQLLGGIGVLYVVRWTSLDDSMYPQPLVTLLESYGGAYPRYLQGTTFTSLCRVKWK